MRSGCPRSGRWPSLAVVVASHDARATIDECLSTLLAQAPAYGAEVVVVDNSTDGTTGIIRDRCPGVRLIARPRSELIPELWTAGILESQGDIVAITTAHCIPDRHWLLEILKAHETAAAGIGGAIESHRSAGPMDWAVYFCRYSHYMLPFAEGPVGEIAADNASYRRADIDQCRLSWQQGFWEPAVHAQLRKRGASLRLVPSIVVYHRRSFGFWGFIRQRFQHGKRYGEERAARLTGAQRALRAVLSPAIPILLLARITRQVLSRRRYRQQFLVTLPVLILFLLAWASGELVGYLHGSPR